MISTLPININNKDDANRPGKKTSKPYLKQSEGYPHEDTREDTHDCPIGCVPYLITTVYYQEAQQNMNKNQRE